MPQFDFATFIPQIFWLLICFSALYYSVSRIILPRISEILAARESRVNSDLSSADELQSKIDQIQEKSEEIRKNSNNSYYKTIENTSKECVLDREKALIKIRSDVEKKLSESEKKINNFIQESQKDYDEIANNIATVMFRKLFGQDQKAAKPSIDKIEN